MSFEYKSIIENIINKYKRQTKYIPKNIKKILKYTYVHEKPEEYKNFPVEMRSDLDIPYDTYVNILYQSLPKGDELIKIIYKEVIDDSEKKDDSSSRDIFDIDCLDTLYIQNNKIKLNNNDINIPEFADFIYKKSQTCKFFVMNLSILDEDFPHQNMLFFENVKGSIILNWYEPHGGKPKYFEIFGDVSKVYKGNFIISYNLNSGIQTKTTEYDIGYCKMFSLLWIYIVLSIIKYNIENKTYIPSPYWINNVELSYINIEPKILYKVIVTFAISLFNNYIATLDKSEIKTIFENVESQLLITKLPLTEHDPYLYQQKRNDEKGDIKEEKTKHYKLTFEQWEELRKIELEKIKNGFREFIGKRGYALIGDECVKNIDCYSNNCEDGFCEPKS